MQKQEFMDLANEIYQLHKAKSGDYGSETLYFPFNDQSYIQMMHVKLTRLISLISSDQPPAFESVYDTVRDLINYSFFYMKFLKGQHE